MTLLAFDPDLLRALERRLVRAVDETRATRATFSDLLADPAAAEAFRLLRAAEVALTDTWLPVVRRVLLSGVFLWRGRVTIDDPFLTPIAIPPATILSPTIAVDAAHVGALVRQLSIIASDPALSATVVRDLTAAESEWAALLDDLAMRRELLLGDPTADPAAVARLDAALAAFAHVVQTALGDGCPANGTLFAPLDAVSPYTASLLVRSLDLDSTTLALVVDHLLLAATPTSADLLFTALLDDPVACQTLVGLAGTHPGVLLDIASDPTLARQVLRIATDPARVDAATAGRLLVPILDHCRKWPYFVEVSADDGGSWPVFLAELCAPWLLQLGPMNHDWGLTVDHQRDLLAFLVADDAAITGLMLRSDEIRQSVLRALDGDSRSFHEFAAWFGLFGEVVLHERVADEQRRADDWGVLLGIASIAAAALPGGAVVAVPVAIGIVALSKIPIADADAVEHDAELAREYALTGAAAAVAVTLAPVGAAPPPTPDPNSRHPAIDFRERFDDWLATLPGGYDGAVADRIDRLVSTLLSAASAGEAIGA